MWETKFRRSPMREQFTLRLLCLGNNYPSFLFPFLKLSIDTRCPSILYKYYLILSLVLISPTYPSLQAQTLPNSHQKMIFGVTCRYAVHKAHTRILFRRRTMMKNKVKLTINLVVVMMILQLQQRLMLMQSWRGEYQVQL